MEQCCEIIKIAYKESVLITNNINFKFILIIRSSGNVFPELFYIIRNSFKISYYIKRSTMDAHSRERKNVAKATRTRCVECRKRHPFL
jgi:hypothetical protein